MMRRFYFLLILLGLLLLPVSWAGDQMNMDFLTHQALQKDVQLQTLNTKLKEELYGPPNRALTASYLLIDGLFGVTYGITNYRALLSAGLVASGSWMGLDTISHIMESKSSKRARQTIKQIEEKNNEIKKAVQGYYAQLKDGLPDARIHLVDLSGEEAVAEVQRNIAMEQAYQKLLNEPFRSSSLAKP